MDNSRFGRLDLLSATEMIMLKLLHFIWCSRECMDPARQRDESICWHTYPSFCCFTNCTPFKIKTICRFWMIHFWLFNVFFWTRLCIRKQNENFEFSQVPKANEKWIDKFQFYPFLYFPSLYVRDGLRWSQRTIESNAEWDNTDKSGRRFVIFIIFQKSQPLIVVTSCD